MLRSGLLSYKISGWTTVMNKSLGILANALGMF
jgi:hypothetical protein